jgi:hypothetical protein
LDDELIGAWVVVEQYITIKILRCLVVPDRNVDLLVRCGSRGTVPAMCTSQSRRYPRAISPCSIHGSQPGYWSGAHMVRGVLTDSLSTPLFCTTTVSEQRGFLVTPASPREVLSIVLSMFLLFLQPRTDKYRSGSCKAVSCCGQDSNIRPPPY